MMRRVTAPFIVLPVVIGMLLPLLAGCSSPVGTDDGSPPDPPTDLTANSGEGRISLTWTASAAEDVAGYRVYRATSELEEISETDPVTGSDLVSEAEYVDDGVENGTKYHYVVTAVDDAENESDPSAEASGTPFAQPPDRPQ